MPLKKVFGSPLLKNIRAGLVLTTIILAGMAMATGCEIREADSPAEPAAEEETVPEVEEEEPDLQPCPSDQEEPGEEAEDADPDPIGEDSAEFAPPKDEDAADEDLKVIADGDYLLALVTKETTLKSSYRPSDLQTVPGYMNPSYSMQLRQEALNRLEELWRAAESDGVILSIRSAYRSYSTQDGLFRDYASRHGEKEANRFSARPGQSEHQLGTAVDFGGTGADFTAAFADTSQGKWLAENAYKYGFALSYPEGREHITGYIFEPWHYRYIGVEEAIAWKESGKTLREYLETRPQEFE